MVQVKDSVSTVQGVNWQRLEQSRQKQSQSLAQSRTSKVGLPFRCDCDEMTRDPSKSVKLLGTHFEWSQAQRHIGKQFCL